MAKAKTAPKKNLTKSGLIQLITESLGEGASRKQVKLTLEALTEIGHKELKKTGQFVLPGFAKFVVVKKRPPRAPGHQPLHQAAHDVRCQAGEQGRQGPPRQGDQGRRGVIRVGFPALLA